MLELVIQLRANTNLCPLIKKKHVPIPQCILLGKVSEMHNEMEMCFVVATHHVCM
jgi:hypothetical protein